MTTEASMWRWLKNHNHPDDILKLERHENLVGVGAPDVWGYHRKHKSFWLELKQVTPPKKSSTKLRIKVRPSQKIWHRSMMLLDCRTNWFLVQVGNKRKYLVPGTLYSLIDSLGEDDIGRFCVSNLTSTELLDKAAKGFD